MSTTATRARPTGLLRLCLLLLAVAVGGPSPAAPAGTAAPVPGRHALATAHPLATAAGEEILQAGGNAFDAAVAVAAALAVVEPAGSGLGGGGFFLLHLAEKDENLFLDARERAPAAAHKDMYLDAEGNKVRGLSLNGPLAAGIPGIPAALEHLSLHFGRLPLAVSLGPAVALAREGFEPGERYRRLAGFRLEALREWPASRTIFLQEAGVPAPGFRLVQQDLADTLTGLAALGAEAFYHGPLAERLVDGVRAAGGIWTLADLAAYRVVERAPLRGRYRGIDIITAPPPSAGGITVVQSLNILEGFELERLDAVSRAHLVAEALRRSQRDRALELGDPDFTPVPVRRLTGKGYAAELRKSIRTDRATPSESLGPIPGRPESLQTTHFSILDAAGNRVAATLSINYPFGSGFTVPGTGVLLNDEMDDFSAKPATANAYGLIGHEANSIEPGKRPLSSMTPTFLEQDGRLGILGTPGGSRIPSMVLLGILDFAAGNGPESWVAVPRYHQQYMPDQVYYESEGLQPELISGLEDLGHTLRRSGRRFGDMQAVFWDSESGRLEAASDPRGEGRAVVTAPP